MNVVSPRCLSPLGPDRHGPTHRSAVFTGARLLNSSGIDALSRWRGRLCETRWFQLFAMVIVPLGLLAVLAGSSADSLTRSLLIGFSLYAELLMALLWSTEKDDARTELSRTRLDRLEGPRR